MSDVKVTPLKQVHEDLGGKMVDFAGWWMPVQYEGLRQEHNAVRNSVGLFDVSHMGEIRVKGPNALKTCEWVTTNLVSKLKNGQAQYTLFPNNQGGVVDDLIVYCIEEGTDYLLCVNASNKDKDLKWVIENNQGADIVDESDYWGQIALQGPNAPKVMAEVMPDVPGDLPGFEFATVTFEGETCFVARTGYTGEDGYEVFIPAGKTVALWKAFMEKGKSFDLALCGLGARDTLRTEMRYPLYGNEIDDTTNPYQAGLGWVVKAKDKDFLGKDLILENKKSLTQKLVGLVMVDRGIARSGYTLHSEDGAEVGRVTSGTPSPTTGDNIAVAYLERSLSEPGTEVFVDIRGRKTKAKVVKTPFVQK